MAEPISPPQTLEPNLQNIAGSTFVTTSSLEKTHMEEEGIKKNRDLGSKCEVLESRVLVLEQEKASLERKCEELGARVSDLVGHCENLESVILLLEAEKEKESSARKLAEEKEAEKKRLEEEIGVWKKRSGELESRVSEFERKLSNFRGELVEIFDSDDGDVNFEKGSPKTSTPKTNCSLKVVASDSEEEDGVPLAKLMKRQNNESKANASDRVAEDLLEDFGDDILEVKLPSTSTCKRKYNSKVVTSDSENDDDDDNVPIGKLKRPRKGLAKEGSKGTGAGDNGDWKNVTPRRRLVKSGERKASTRDSVARNSSHTKTSSGCLRERPSVRRKLGFFILNSGDEEEDGDDIDSDSDSGSSGKFIASSSDSPETHSESDDSSEEQIISNDSSDEELNSDPDVALGNVLGKYFCKKDVKIWEYEADMLASLARDPELCMLAVCALYRQQTSEEQSLKGTIVTNGRGFSHFDALKGSMIAEFLLDGNPYGPVKKSVQELEAYDPKGLDYCHKLANRYSKQLFTIYQQGEDPFFSA